MVLFLIDSSGVVVCSAGLLILRRNITITKRYIALTFRNGIERAVIYVDYANCIASVYGLTEVTWSASDTICVTALIYFGVTTNMTRTVVSTFDIVRVVNTVENTIIVVVGITICI